MPSAITTASSTAASGEVSPVMSSRKVKAIYIHWPGAERLWRDDLFGVVADRHDLVEYDPSKSVESQLAGVEAVLDHGGHGMTREIIKAGPDLRLWQMITVGYDAIDLSIVDGSEIAVCHCPGATSAAGLAETAMMFMLMLVKRYNQAQGHLADGIISNLTTDELSDKKLAIIGFGASGRRLAALAGVFGMRLMIIEPLEIDSGDLERLPVEFVGKPDDLDRVMGQADFISLHLPVMPETRGFIDARRIALMKPTACFINVARAALVDEDALNEALVEGRIAGIGSDVFTDNRPGREISTFRHDNLVALPHLAGGSCKTIHRRHLVCLENLDRIARGEEPIHRVR